MVFELIIMAVIVPIRIVEVLNYREFCMEFDIKFIEADLEDNFQEELIIEKLDKIKDENWIVMFQDDNNEGFFKLLQLE